MHDTPESQILACEADLLRAMRTSDADLLDELLHDDLLFNGPTGETANKAQDLANYRSGGIDLHTVESSDTHTSVIGDNVVVCTTVVLAGMYMGQALDTRARYLRVWKRVGGRYQVIGGSVIPLPVV